MSPCKLPSKANRLEKVTKHPTLSFTDGNLALLAWPKYFIVHKGLLCRHSPILRTAVEALENSRCLEGRPVLQVQDNSEDMFYFLIAIYDGIAELPFTAESFPTVSALIRLATKYQVNRLRKELLRRLSIAWPSSLASWDAREDAMLNSNNIYEPRKFTPHPILIINLARSVKAPELLPACFYDLSRFPVSSTAAGYIASDTNECHQLSEEDLFALFKGREDASRFLSTFLVNQLEFRRPSVDCLYSGDHLRRRFCQAAFENIYYDILRDTNSLVCFRSCDPLFTIKNAELMQEMDDGGQRVLLRPCEYCRAEFRLEVEAARDEFWHSLPEWFGDIQVTAWG
ncbi:hypothetical protein BDP27DRAFT_1262261 [Rhodocollybia butyracea]|uniref:BTB domain-containing protein n=1 Tax=Rhodocollybia butyracea TaxID=206335 RepID=A0A9P5UB20_9AGAR|nr:hypothetical protein BDP27DRAFT_1262261 [Rhodocollybia butyracea]